MSASDSNAPRSASWLSDNWPMLGLVVLSGLYVPLRLAMESPTVSDAFYRGAYFYGTALQMLFAATIVAVAVMIGLRQSVGRQWMLLGIGVTLYAVGDVCWTLFELFLEIDPYPSVADIFYVAEYVFFLAALVIAIRGYSALVRTRNPVLAGATVAAVGVAIVYFALLRPYIIPAGVEELGTWGLIVSMLYPLGDVVFMLAPAVTLALVVRQLGAGALARPWWFVVVGALVFALVDSFFVYTDWAGIGYTAALDFGYILANLLFASAALVARNVYRGR